VQAVNRARCKPPLPDGSVAKLVQTAAKYGADGRLHLNYELDLVGAILRDIKALGVAGEEDTALTLYLVATSRKLKRPLSALVRGESSSGKSFLVDWVAELVPPEEVLRATTLTPQALYHLEAPIAHKLVVGGERCRAQDNATAERTAALRQLRSEGRIVKQITERDGDTFKTREAKVEGPISFVESTTLDKALIFPEDLNRGLVLQTDVTEAQTRRVLREMARAYSPKAGPVNTQAVIDRHHEFQRGLESVEVVIPFAEALAEKLPATEAQSRRVFGQLVAMVETVALLHQHQRRRDDHGRLVATAADYRLARHLLLKPLEETIGLSDDQRDVYRCLREKVGNPQRLEDGTP
jgi:hypothetical protein